MKQLTSLDFQKNEIQNAVLQVIAGNATTPALGQMWFNSTANRPLWQGSGGALDLTARANHTGTQLAATISDLSTTVLAYRLDQFAVPTAPVSLNSQRITNVATPTADTDAANKAYVDGLVNGTDWKNAVRVGTTANITLSGLLTIDGITLVAGDRVLVKNQTAAETNGLYAAASGAWTRTADADTSAEVTADLAVFIEEGTTLADTQWRLTTNNPIVLGTTALTFAQIGAGSSYTAGAGITIAGSVISLDTATAVRKFAQTVGDGSATSFTLSHNLGTLDVQVQVVEVSTGATVNCDHTRGSTSQVTVSFAVAPTASQYRVIVQG